MASGSAGGLTVNQPVFFAPDSEEAEVIRLWRRAKSTDRNFLIMRTGPLVRVFYLDNGGCFNCDT